MRMKRKAAGLLAAMALIGCALIPPAGARAGEPIAACHRVSNHYKETRQANKSVIRLWQVETVLPAVTEEINGIARDWAEELGPGLPAASGNKKNSRLEVDIRYSRTGHTWLSFLVQARTIRSQKLTDQRFTTRTYDMTTGERITLEDVFDGEADTWSFLGERVRTALAAYWPEEEPDPEKLDALCAPEALREADFTLHGMSMVLHYPARTLYEGRHSLMEVTLFYPEIRDRMTETAALETDNLRYYDTCALTFDDGPSGTNSPKVLASLMETGARATFFVIGNRIADYEGIVVKEHDEGHAVAAHNWHHGNVTKSSGTALRAMPEKVNRAMIRAIGIPVRYDRVPGGRYPRMIKISAGWA